MSRITDEIKAHQFDKRVNIEGSYSDLCKIDSAHWTIDYSYGWMYRIGVNLENRVVIKDGDNHDYYLHKTRRDVAEFIFGEFREHIRILNKALYNRDYDKALEASDKIYDTMFNV